MYESIFVGELSERHAAYCGQLSDITTSGMPWRAKNDFNCSIIDSESVRWSLATSKTRE